MLARANWIDDDESDVEMREHKNDIWYENGTLATCTGLEAYAQTIEAVIETVYGEIQVDREYGIPYFSTIWTNSRLQDRWADSVRRAVLELPFVDTISDFTYNFDGNTNIFSYTLSVVTVDGEQVVAQR